MSAQVLAVDVTTQWGIYAHGTPVDIAESTDTEYVIVLADLPRNRLLARVPRSVVRRAGGVPARTRRAPLDIAAVGPVAAAWSEGEAA